MNNRDTAIELAREWEQAHRFTGLLYDPLESAVRADLIDRIEAALGAVAAPPATPQPRRVVKLRKPRKPKRAAA